jgi:hypothetical protein
MATTEVERRLMQLEQTFSERIAKLEEQVAELSQHAREAPSAPDTAWWKRLVGVFKDDPEFEEAMRLGREYRESLRQQEPTEGTG